MPKRYRQLQVNDLPKVPTWWLEWDSNLRPFGRKALTLPMLHYTHKHSEKNPYFGFFTMPQNLWLSLMKRCCRNGTITCLDTCSRQCTSFQSLCNSGLIFCFDSGLI